MREMYVGIYEFQPFALIPGILWLDLSSVERIEEMPDGSCRFKWRGCDTGYPWTGTFDEVAWFIRIVRDGRCDWRKGLQPYGRLPSATRIAGNAVTARARPRVAA